MKNKIVSVVLVVSVVFSASALVSCSKEESYEAENLKRQMKIENNDLENPAYENEEDGVVLSPKKHNEEDFVGNWKAPSDRAEYLYGNVNLRINEDGTWSGNITEESFQGRWKYNGTGITIRDSEGIINWELFYDADGTLMFKDRDEPEDPLVLKPGPGSK